MSPLQADESYDIVVKGWECQETDRGVPFYTHKSDGRTDWDHPYYTKVIEELDTYQEVHYAAYRTALKLRHLQKKFGLHLLSLQCLQSVLSDHGFPPGCGGMMDSQCLQLVLLDIFHTPDFRHFDTFRQDVASELLHNYLLNLFDMTRTGVLRVMSVKLALAALCNSNLSEKYQYFFHEIKSSPSFVNCHQLSVFISDLIQIPDLLRESVAFGKNVSAAVESCASVAGTLGEGVPEKGFYSWLMREPQTLIWLPTLHRLIATETVRHECKCSVCKATPIVGFRYKCLQCFKFNICQDCFFRGRVAKNHQVRHPIQEYCLPVTASDETKVFFKVVRNKMSRRRNKRSSKMAFLPVDNTTDQGMMEWEMRAAPPLPSSPSTSQSVEGIAAEAEGEAASSDSGNSSDQGGEGGSQQSPEPSSPSPRSLYDNSNSPAKYLEERQPRKIMQQDRHSLIHLVHSLRKENRLLRQQLRSQSCIREEAEQRRSVATAEVTAQNSVQSQPLSLEIHSQGLAHSHRNGPSVSGTISPIGDMSTTAGSHQPYTSDFFNSILAATTATISDINSPNFDVTGQESDVKGDEMVFASTPAMKPGEIVQKNGPRKPPRLTGLGEKNTVSISYIHPADTSMETEREYAPGKFLHTVEVYNDSTPNTQESAKFHIDSTNEKSVSMNSFVDGTPGSVKNEVSCDEMWADDTPCTIRKRAAKPTCLASGLDSLSMDDTREPTDPKARRNSTGCVKNLYGTRSREHHFGESSKILKSFSSLRKLGIQSPGVDKSLFTISHGDSILKTPERQEIDAMIQWIDNAFPSDLSYSALSLYPEESMTQKKMLRAAENIGQAMGDLVQAASDNCYK